MSRADDVTPRLAERRERSGPSARSAWPPRWPVPPAALASTVPSHRFLNYKKPLFPISTTSQTPLLATGFFCYDV